MNRSRPYRRPAVLLLALWTSGCVTWHDRHESIGTILEARPAALRITSDQYNRVVLSRAEMRNDSVIGYSGSTLVPIAVNSITLVQTQSINAGKSVAFVLGIGAAAFVGLVLLVAASCKSGGGECI